MMQRKECPSAIHVSTYSKHRELSVARTLKADFGVRELWFSCTRKLTVRLSGNPPRIANRSSTHKKEK